ncbi:UNVERIFIED_ORG: ABC transporter permease [Bacillus sp. AZ43]
MRRQRASVLRVRDQLTQALTALLERPGRTALSIGLVAVGAALVVIVTALGASAERQVSARFDALRATAVQVGVAGSGGGPGTAGAAPLIRSFPADAGDRLARLRNVSAAGSLLIRTEDAEVALSPVTVAAAPPLAGSQLVLSDPGLADAADLGLTGRWIDAGDVAEGRRVVVLGHLLAERLGLTVPRGSLLVDGLSYSLVGIVEESPLRPDLLDSVVIARPADDLGAWDVSAESVVIVRSLPGAAQQVAAQAPRQLRPEDPAAFTASAPQDPAEFRESLEGDTKAVMQAFAVAGGGLGVLATLLVWWSSVSARRGAIGLWRALGATRPHVFRLIITECLAGGVVAGLVGSSAGLAVVALVCLQRDWQLVMSPGLVPLTIVGSTVLGGLAGCLPAWQATRMDPVDSLRTG